MGGYVALVPILTVFCLQVATGFLEPPTIGHLSAIYYVPEGGVLQVCLTVLSAPAGSLELPLFIQVDDFSGGQTADSADYDTSAFPVTVQFEIGDSIGAIRCATQEVSIFSDGLPEGPESFAVLMVFDFTSYYANPAVGLITIADEDDDPMVSLSAAMYSAFENETSVTICAVLNLLDSEFPSGLLSDMTVELSTTDGTAVAPDDYTAISSAQLAFPAGSVNGATDCVDVAIVDDMSLEPSESFTVSLSNLQHLRMASIGAPSSAVVNIEDITVSADDEDPVRGGGGSVYTRWGRTTCPGTSGAEKLYDGLAAGSFFSTQGGAADHLCMPKEPEYYSQFQAGSYGGATLYGAQYQAFRPGPLSALQNQNVPCAVCYVPRVVAMIPARVSCPEAWMLEYRGYLMSEADPHQRTRYECVDEEAESLPDSAGALQGALFYFNEATCTGLPCPPYDTEHEISCAVCSR